MVGGRVGLERIRNLVSFMPSLVYFIVIFPISVHCIERLDMIMSSLAGSTKSIHPR